MPGRAGAKSRRLKQPHSFMESCQACFRGKAHKKRHSKKRKKEKPETFGTGHGGSGCEVLHCRKKKRDISLSRESVPRNVGNMVSLVAQKGWTFKPFTLLAEEGASGGGADDVITKLAKRIADKGQNEQARVVESTIRRRIAFAVIRGTSRCVRSKRVVWNKVGLCVYDG